MNTPINSDMPYLMPILELKKHLPQDLCKIIDYYAVLIEVLRAKLPERITYTVADKAKIARAGHEIKNHLGQTINLVTPATIMRWFRELKAGAWFYNNACAKTGRPPISPDTVAIIVRLASDKQMGYRSIQGELKKLGHQVSANTIKRVLRENGFPIGGKKFGLKWSEFIRINMKVTWACDFITTDISTPQGFVRLYSLFFLHHGSRNVFYAGTTNSPDERWVKQQARNFSMHLQDHPEYPCKYLIHNRDGALKPLKHFLKHDKIKTILTPPETP